MKVKFTKILLNFLLALGAIIAMIYDWHLNNTKGMIAWSLIVIINMNACYFIILKEEIRDIKNANK